MPTPPPAPALTARETEARLLHAGYRPGPPPRLTTDAVAIDHETAAGSFCEDCGHRGLAYSPFHHPRTGSYVALALCERCGAALEF